jgi:hypothetical protein
VTSIYLLDIRKVDRASIVRSQHGLRETLSVYSWLGSMGPDSQPKTLRKNNLDMTSESEIQRELVIKNDSILNSELWKKRFEKPRYTRE